MPWHIRKAKTIGLVATGRVRPTPTGRIWRLGGLGLLFFRAVSAMAAGANSGPASVDFFESRVRPVLVEHCYKCHSAQSKDLKGGLRLDGLAEMRKGGDTGPAVVPGDINASLLVKAVRYDDEL